MDTTSASDKIFSALAAQQGIRDNAAQAYLTGGLTMMQKKKYKEAAAAFKAATAMKPDYVDAYNMLASAYTQLGEKKKAVEAYTISLKLDPKQDQVNYNLANIYIEDKKFVDAEKALKAALNPLKGNPANAVAQYTLAHLYVQMEKYPQAEAAFRQTIRLSPRDGNAYYGLGMALNKEGRHEEAIAQLQKATELKKDFAPAMFESGSAYVAVGNTDKVQEQIAQLKNLKTSQGDSLASDLGELIRRPKIVSVNTDKSSFKTSFGTISLIALDPETFIDGSAVKEFTMRFKFDSEMDIASVTNSANWKIGRSGGGTAGLYDNGLYRPTDRAGGVIMPRRVTYDPTTQEATVYFPISQNEDKTGTIDTTHLTFKFLGKDISGKTMDPTADEFNGFSGTPF